jgi:hypothetical protein
MSKSILLQPEGVEALGRVLEYLADEEEHFEACEPRERTGHIWTDVQTLAAHLGASERHGPDIPAAVREMVDMIEAQTSLQSSKRNSEVIAGCRIALNALINTKRLDKAKEFLAAHEQES